MNQKIKILIAFLSIIVMTVGQVSVNYLLNVKLIKFSESVYSVESQLDLMSQQVIGYDAMLTDHIRSAVLDAQLGDTSAVQRHRADYDRIGERLDTLLKKEAPILINKSSRPRADKEAVIKLLADLDIVNIALVRMETDAFTALGNGDIETARSLAIGEDYESYKQELLSFYQHWAALEQKQTGVITESLKFQSDFLMYFNLLYSIITLALLVLVLIYFKSFFREHSKR